MLTDGTFKFNLEYTELNNYTQTSIIKILM